MNIINFCRLCINFIDAVITVLLLIRLKFVYPILKRKVAENKPAHDPSREEEHFVSVMTWAKRIGLPREIMTPIIRSIMDAYTSWQILITNGRASAEPRHCKDCSFNTVGIPAANNPQKLLCPKCHKELSTGELLL